MKYVGYEQTIDLTCYYHYSIAKILWHCVPCFKVADSLEALDRASADGAIEQQQPQVQPVQPPSDTECFTYTALKSTTFLKIILRETSDMVLYENNAYTVLLDEAEERAAVEMDNERYDFLTIGKGQQRKTSDAEAQTQQKLLKTRAVNTDRIRKKTVGTFVSNYDMFDTYADLESHTTNLDVEAIDKTETLAITTYTLEGSGVDLSELLQESKSFKLSSMILQRILASNVYRERQRRFRNMDAVSPLDKNVRYYYRTDLLFTYKTVTTVGTAVTSYSWCENADILAVGYGVYNIRPNMDRMSGFVCLWNIKNPVNPERFYKFPVAVTALAFSKQQPQLLAIGLYNGHIEIMDVTADEGDETVYTSQRCTSPAIEAISNLTWLRVGDEEQLLAASQDGYVIKYALTNSPHIIGGQLMQADRIEGVIEGIAVDAIALPKLQANRHAQILTLELDPLHSQMYYIGTDEGCLRKCSIYYPNQSQHQLQVHKYSVTCMEFSPWSPRIFLTSGTDWHIRIWIDGILEPIIELTSGLEPVQNAHWCPDNSTIIAATKRAKLEIWDLTTNILAPAATEDVCTGSATLTICEFSKCGKSIAVGDSQGTTYVYALEDMPFPPHFQFHALEGALLASLELRPGLKEQVLAMGHLGY